MHGRFAPAALTMMLVLSGSGCTMHDGGYMPSAAGTWSPMTFQSTAAAPKTVAIVDTRVGETVFEVDIPIGQQLSIEFFMNKHRHDHLEAPDYMMYTLHTIGRVIGHLDQRVDVPAPWNRRIDVFLRTPETYTAPDPTRMVEPLDVPLPEAAVKPKLELPTDVPIPGEASTPAEIDQPVETPVAEPAAAEKTAETPAVEPEAADTPEESPAVKPAVDTPEEPPAAEPAAAHTPAEAPAAEPTAADTPAEPPPPGPAGPDAYASTTPESTMTWTDTGHTRRVWVTDLRTGDRVFELDVPRGSDLVLHFFHMWTPKGGDQDVQSMHWEIVPAGGHVSVPAHHATVPSEPFRRISEQGVQPPPPEVPAETPKAEQPAKDEPTPAPSVDLLDDADEQPAESANPA